MCKGFAHYKRLIALEFGLFSVIQRSSMWAGRKYYSGYRAEGQTPRLFFALVIIFLFTACQSSAPNQTARIWTYADLHALDPADSPNPNHDLIAIYSRNTATDIEVRIDFLDLRPKPDYDLYLALDFRPGGTNSLPLETSAGLSWDVLINLPTLGSPQVLRSDWQPVTEVIPRVFRDPLLDTVEFRFNRKAVPEIGEDFTVQAFLTAPGSPRVLDTLGPVRTDISPPTRVPLLLAFWNTFPAYTPAQALRRWDGAHSGPFGERHGLRHLITNAERFHVPIALLDLKSPFALSALDYLDVLPDIRAAAKDGVLILPDVLPLPQAAADGHMPFSPPNDVLRGAIEFGQKTSLEFGLSYSQMLYAPIVPSPQTSSHRLLFIPSGGADALFVYNSPWETSYLRLDGSTLIHIPEIDGGLQATETGLALPLRLALVQYATAEDPPRTKQENSIFILGGDLQDAAWGDPQAARNTMHYIASRPWLHPLGTTDLLTGRGHAKAQNPPVNPPTSMIPYTSQGTPIPSGWTAADLQEMIIPFLLEGAPEDITNLAWQAYLALLTPNPPESSALPALRANYLGQIGALRTVADWAENPTAFTTCDVDPDFDGQPECILASEHIFTLFELDGARLLFAFSHDNLGVVQWIAPLSQFYVGGSDPASWSIELGPASDPNEIPGAFSDVEDRWSPYTVTILPDGLAFESQDGTRRKTFKLTARGVHAAYEGPEDRQISVQIPIGLAPNLRFTSGWATRYIAETTPQFIHWKTAMGPSVEIRATGELSTFPFNASLQGLGFPEDPNFDYPPGHYLPFPLNLVEIRGSGYFEVEINIDP
jgi:hypothetical protein